MNSTAGGEDADFPANPFRSAGQPQQQQDFFSTAATPAPAAFAQPVVQQQQPAMQQQQFAPQQQQPVYAQPAPAPYNGAPAAPTGQMNANAAQQPAQMSRWETCMSCFKMETYTAYYDVDTQDIADRLKYSILYFYHPDKFRCEVVGAARTDSLKGPDLYGPLWITMTLVFFVAVST